MTLSARIVYLIQMDGEYDRHAVYTPAQMAAFWHRAERYARYVEGLNAEPQT